jgi:phosphohistidine phosphatase
MLCRLLLVRHAKAASPQGMDDHDRPLDEKGISDTPKVAQKIKSLGYKPELALVSDSRRTMETWSLLAQNLSDQVSMHSTPALYNSDVSSYLGAIEQTNFNGHTLLLIGHNPVLEDLILHLSSNTREMKPAWAAVLEIHSDDWKNAIARPKVWKLVNIISC